MLISNLRNSGVVPIFSVRIFTETFFADIPNPLIFDSGTISVTETYGKTDSKNIEIYWERLKSFASDPQAIILINGGPGLPIQASITPTPRTPESSFQTILSPSVPILTFIILIKGVMESHFRSIQNSFPESTRLPLEPK